MNSTKQLALHAYYQATLPLRWRANAVAARDATAPVMVLFYHRVADVNPNEWTMSRKTFAKQIRWLQANFDLVSLPEAQQRLRGGNSRAAVSITFDDGYAENCDFAMPLLAEQGIPCTYFVTLDNVTNNTPFAHDVKAGVPLPVNSIEQLRDLAEAGVEIGAHTRTHPDLGAIANEDQLYDEVVRSADELQDSLAKPVRYFAFPFGLHANLNARAFHMARDAGFEAVCSAYGGYNFPGDDAFHLQRIHADPQMLRLKNWLTVDPRKLRSVRRFEYLALPQATLQPAMAAP